MKALYVNPCKDKLMRLRFASLFGKITKWEQPWSFSCNEIPDYEELWSLNFISLLYFVLRENSLPWEILSLHFCPTADALLNPNSADALSSARLLAVPVSCSKGKPFVLSPFGQFSFFPVIGVCEAFPAGKCTSQAAGPNVQRERSLCTSYDTDIWQIDLTSLSPPLLDNALIPRVKALLNAGTLKMWLASALQSTWRALICLWKK